MDSHKKKSAISSYIKYWISYLLLKKDRKVNIFFQLNIWKE